MNVGRPPGIAMIAPRVGARFDGNETIVAALVRDRAPGAAEVRVKRRAMIVDMVTITAGRIALPQFNQRVRNRPAILVHYTAGDDDPLAQRLACMLAREVV